MGTMVVIEDERTIGKLFELQQIINDLLNNQFTIGI